MQKRHHYEQAFEEYLRVRRMPYVAVHEARKALLPEGDRSGGAAGAGGAALKSFDFVLYRSAVNLLVDVKGRKVAARGAAGGRARAGRLESWVTQEDVESLTAWEGLFGEGFRAAFVFVYWCDQQPTLPLFEEIFEFRGRWYAIRAVLVGEYARAMRARSSRWKTVHLGTADFDRLSRSLAETEGAGV